MIDKPVMPEFYGEYNRTKYPVSPIILNRSSFEILQALHSLSEIAIHKSTDNIENQNQQLKNRCLHSKSIPSEFSAIDADEKKSHYETEY